MTLVVPAVSDVVDRTSRRSGVQIRELATPQEANRGADVLAAVWGSAEPVAPGNLLRAVQHTGGYVFGAYDDEGVLLAVSVGLLAAAGLHSHITGVVPAGQRRGLGLALKQHQRAWALERGLTTITWTADPLVRRNTAFNLHALGADLEDYLVDHYGPMSDGVNRGDESDRFEVHWHLLSARAVQAEQARIPWLDTDVPAAVVEGADGLPEVRDAPLHARQVQLPDDVEALRRTRPEAARAWRLAVREALLPAFEAGAVARGLTAGGALVLGPAEA